MSLAAFLQNPFAEGAHTLIPFGFAQMGFVGSSAAIVALGALAFASDAGGSIMDSHIPMPYFLSAVAFLVTCTWIIAKYIPSFASKKDLRESEKRIKEDFSVQLRQGLHDLRDELTKDRK